MYRGGVPSLFLRRLVLLGGLVCSLATTQQVGAQTAADTARVFYTVAEDLRLEGKLEEAEALYEIILSRYADTPVAQDAQGRLLALRAGRRAAGGRGEVISWNTIYGAALGVLIPAALGADEPEPYGVGLLLGGPLGFLGSKAYANSTSMTPGQARAITFGTWWGTWQGIGWREVFNIGDGEVTQCYDTGFGQECYTYAVESDEAPFTAAVIGGLAGLTAGVVMSRNLDIPTTTALIANFGAMWGSWYGLAAAEAVGIEDDDDGKMAAVLLGGDVGLFAGAVAAPALRMSTSRAWLVHLSGIAGLIGGLGLDLLTQPDDEQVAILIPAATSLVGLIAGYATTKPADRRPDVGGGALAPALLAWHRGRASLGLPVPVPALLPSRDPGKRYVPGLRLHLLQATW
jgi:hypothetical protein